MTQKRVANASNRRQGAGHPSPVTPGLDPRLSGSVWTPESPVETETCLCKTNARILCEFFRSADPVVSEPSWGSDRRKNARSRTPKKRIETAGTCDQCESTGGVATIFAEPDSRGTSPAMTAIAVTRPRQRGCDDSAFNSRPGRDGGSQRQAHQRGKTASVECTDAVIATPDGCSACDPAACPIVRGHTVYRRSALRDARLAAGRRTHWRASSPRRSHRCRRTSARPRRSRLASRPSDGAWRP